MSTHATTAAQGQQGRHTPGPWKTGTPGNGRFCVYAPASNGRGICVMSNTQKSWGTAMVARHGDHPLNIEADANARLIAASPDLLSALKLIVADAESHGMTDDDVHLKEARAAIAKAEGKP